MDIREGDVGAICWGFALWWPFSWRYPQCTAAVSLTADGNSGLLPAHLLRDALEQGGRRSTDLSSVWCG
jgi:hypothetical protein